MPNHSLSIIVSSCDKFKDCWHPFIFAFNKAWPDCRYNKFIISNYETIDDSDFRFLQIGEDRQWGDNLTIGLQLVPNEFVLYLQEDYWLDVPINSSFIDEQLDYCVNNNLDYLRLTFPWSDKNQTDNSHALSPSSQPYGICLQAAIWRKSFLLSLIKPGLSGWDFEDLCNHLGSTDFNSQVLLEDVSRREFHYIDAVRKGRWTRIGDKWLKNNNFEETLNLRQQEGLVLTYSSWFQSRGGKIVRTIARRLNRLM